MKIMSKQILFLGLSFVFSMSMAQDNQIKYYGKDSFLVGGTPFQDSTKENDYDRMPLAYKTEVSEAVWYLSKSSAGLTASFSTNSSIIKVKWEVLFDNKMDHMAETGVKGIDLYYKNGDTWQYINTARPTAKKSEYLLVNSMKVEMREYKMFLPLYDGILKMEIGIDRLSKIEKAKHENKKPIVFYGTSITQGGCASRPGMAHTNIISRKLNMECYNFGFSGNGRMEKPIVEMIARIDAAFYIIDCIPNVGPKEASERIIPLVEIIRAKKPNTPIVFVEQLMYEKGSLDNHIRNIIEEKNKVLKEEFKKLQDKGVKNLYYIEAKNALGNDHEATVDGLHYTDLGFMRFADYFILKFKDFELVK